jgi:hypothetical protein
MTIFYFSNKIEKTKIYQTDLLNEEEFTKAIQMVATVNSMMAVVVNIFRLILENIHQAHKRMSKINDHLK